MTVATPARPQIASASDCPRWCEQAGAHPFDRVTGSRVHERRVGAWASVVQVDHPGGRLPAAVTVADDVELSPVNALALALDLAEAAKVIRTAP